MKNLKSLFIYALLAGVIVAVVVAPAMFYWHSAHLWQHPVNLDSYYQARIAFASPHDHDRGNNLAQMPAGHRIIDGVRFNVAGLIEVACANDLAQSNNPYPYPTSVEDIPVNRFCRKIHLLHGTTGSAADQTLVAKLVLHYVDGTTADLDIIYGEQVYDWWFKGDGYPPLAGNTKVAWVGENKSANRNGYRIRVFKTSFNNPKPGARVETIDYDSALAPASSPFMVALTAE